jgi:Transposase DDE domain
MSEVFDRFCEAAPFAVMTRVLVEDFIGTRLDRVFEDHRQSQYEYIASFQAVAITVADVALRFCENFNQSYKKHAEELRVSVQSFYDKTRGVEPAVSEAMVAESAIRAAELQQALGMKHWEVIPGYRCLTVDGNVLSKSDKRLGVLRNVKGAPQPGKVVARFDLQRQLFDKSYVLLDGHAQESSCCDRIVADLQANDVLIADRHYCIVAFMEGITKRQACFIMRQHGRLPGVLLGKRRLMGKVETGLVYEQSMRLTADEDALVVRRITVVLNEPTRDGATEIHLLTNLPNQIASQLIAEAYRHRWEEETAFNVLQMTLTCELASIGHPNAATFLFCMSVLAYNLRQTIFAALFAVQPEEEVLEVSHLHVSKNVSDYTPGMLVSITSEQWDELIPTKIKGVAALLKRIASTINLRKFKKSTRGPKKKKPFRSRNVASSHVSTAKLLGIIQS